MSWQQIVQWPASTQAEWHNIVKGWGLCLDDLEHLNIVPKMTTMARSSCTSSVIFLHMQWSIETTLQSLQWPSLMQAKPNSGCYHFYSATRWSLFKSCMTDRHRSWQCALCIPFPSLQWQELAAFNANENEATANIANLKAACCCDSALSHWH